MRPIEIFIFVSILGFVVYGIVTAKPIPTKIIYVSVSNSQLEKLEERVNSLETWAQRQGMKY